MRGGWDRREILVCGMLLCIFYIFIYISSYSWDGVPRVNVSRGAARPPHVCELRQHARPCTLERDYYTLSITDWLDWSAHAPRTPPSNRVTPISIVDQRTGYYQVGLQQTPDESCPLLVCCKIAQPILTGNPNWFSMKWIRLGQDCVFMRQRAKPGWFYPDRHL